MIIVNDFDIFIDRNTVKKLYFKLFIASLMKNTVINQNSLKDVGVVVSNGNMQTNICYQWKYFLQVIYILSLMTMDKQMHRL
jgi:hypothetical protein